uniref:Uncharacterized protein n=1 Tax=Rhizophora mucronata TaxID=61149 RepID=A0A2P2PFF0_RHIMU
MNPLLGFGFS